MWPRVAVVLATIAGFHILWTVQVTLPALALLGLTTWAVVATVIAAARREPARPTSGQERSSHP